MNIFKIFFYSKNLERAILRTYLCLKNDFYEAENILNEYNSVFISSPEKKDFLITLCPSLCLYVCKRLSIST